MTEATENDVLNLIADIRSLNDQKEEADERLSKARFELESAEDDVSDLKSDLERKREELDNLIDELTDRDDGSDKMFRL